MTQSGHREVAFTARDLCVHAVAQACCGVVRSGCCDVSTPSGTVFEVSAASRRPMG